MKKLPNPISNDVPQINLVLDSGTRGQKIKTLRPDTNRTDPLAGFTWELSKALLLPNGLDDSLFHLVTLAAAGGLTAAIVFQFANLVVFVALGAVLLSLSFSTVAACRAFPPVTIHAAVKVCAVAAGALLTLAL